MFQKDCAQPPPKILISSVSEDRSMMPPSFRVTATRSWSSDDILTDSPHTDDPIKPVEEILTNNGDPQLSYTHSPTGSSVPESVNTESVMDDSAISSPDSWVESELAVAGEKDGESQSCLCDIGTAWDVYRATPVEVTAIDEGFIPSIEERAADEQSLSECCVDEGIYSLSSLESMQDRFQGHAKKREVRVAEVEDSKLERNNKDLETEQVPEQINTEVITQLESESLKEKEQESSAEVSDFGAEDILEPQILSSNTSSDYCEESVKENIIEDGTHRDEKCVKKSVDAQNHKGETNSQSEFLQDINVSEEVELETECHKTDCCGSLENKKEPEMLKGRNEVLVETQDEASEGLLKDSPDSQDTNNSVQITKALENTSSTNTEEVLTTSQDPSIGMNIPSISIVSVPEEQEHGTADENLSQPLVFVSEVTDMCVNSTANPGEKSSTSNKDDKIIAEGLFENAKATSSGELMDPENQHLNDVNEHNLSSNEYMQGQIEISEDGDKCKPPLDDSQGETNFSTEAETHIVDIEHAVNSTDPPDGHESKLADTQLSTLDPFNTEPSDEIGTLRSEPATVSRNMDVLFYTDFDRGSPTEDLVGDPVEPMDLFYPDKEELMFTDQPDTEAQTWPSVLSVSALQPAPPSDILPDDQQFDPLGEDFREVDLIQEHDEVNVNLFHFLGALRSVTLLRCEFSGAFSVVIVFSLAIAPKVCTAAAVQTYTTRHCL